MFRQNYSEEKNHRGRAIQPEKGGTGAITNQGAVDALNAVNSDRINRPGGVAGLGSNGFYPNSILPSGVGIATAVNIEGPLSVNLGVEALYKITNFDSFTTYTFTSNKVELVRMEEDSFIIRPTGVGTDVWFALNGSIFNVSVAILGVDFNAELRGNYPLGMLPSGLTSMSLLENANSAVVGVPFSTNLSNSDGRISLLDHTFGMTSGIPTVQVSLRRNEVYRKKLVTGTKFAAAGATSTASPDGGATVISDFPNLEARNVSSITYSGNGAPRTSATVYDSTLPAPVDHPYFANSGVGLNEVVLPMLPPVQAAPDRLVNDLRVLSAPVLNQNGTYSVRFSARITYVDVNDPANNVDRVEEFTVEGTYAIRTVFTAGGDANVQLQADGENFSFSWFGGTEDGAPPHSSSGELRFGQNRNLGEKVFGAKLRRMYVTTMPRASGRIPQSKGEARIYMETTPGVWDFQNLDLNDVQTGTGYPSFGTSVAMNDDGSLVYIGAPGIGSIVSYKFDGFQPDGSFKFSRRAIGTPNATAAGEAFGTSIAIASIQADIVNLFVGAPNKGPHGTIYYGEFISNFLATREITVANLPQGMRIGHQIAVEKTMGLMMTVATDPNKVNKNQVLVFNRDGDLSQVIEAPAISSPLSGFGSTILVNQEKGLLFITEPGYSAAAGQVHIYSLYGNQWMHYRTVNSLSYGGGPNDGFGHAISSQDGKLAVLGQNYSGQSRIFYFD